MTAHRLIVLEGLDCSGKTTVSKILVQRLQPCIGIRFPDRSTETGAVIDRFLRNESQRSMSREELHLLYSANRYEKAEFIRESLRTQSVVCDRYWLSGAVYSAAKGLDYEWCKNSDRLLPHPDYTFFIDVDAKSVARRKGFGLEAHDDLLLQQRVYDIYKAKAASEDVKFVDGERSPEEIAEDILRILHQCPAIN